MLVVEKLKAGYGKMMIVTDFNLKLDESEILAIIGPNGAGKSTALKAIMGLTEIYDGKVVFNGEDITKLPPHEKIKRGLAYVPQVGNIFPNLTVYENLYISSKGLKKNEFKLKLKEILDLFPELKDRVNYPSYKLSGGERQLLAISMALIKGSKTLLLDEPTAMLSPANVKKVLSSVSKLRELGYSIIIVEQNAKSALEIADKAVIMVSGKTVMEGKAIEIASHPKLGRLLLGYLE
jgi:branched-chain amino acid transport system ATP-binding protein